MANDAMRKALEQASSAGATRALESLPQKDVETAELGTGEASKPLNTPGNGYIYTPPPAPADLTAQPAPPATPDMDKTPAPEVEPAPEIE